MTYLAVVDEMVELAFVFVREMLSVNGIVEGLDQGPATIIAQVAVDNLFLPFFEGPIKLWESHGK